MRNVECNLVNSSAVDTVRMTGKCEIPEVRMGFNTCQHYLSKKAIDVPDVTNSCRRATLDQFTEPSGAAGLPGQAEKLTSSNG